MTTVAVFTTLMKRIVLFGIDGNFKSDSVLDFIILDAEYFNFYLQLQIWRKTTTSVMCIHSKELKIRKI